MHIPDNYLSPSTCAVLGVSMVPVWKKAITKVKKEITREKMPLLGIGAAFSFLVMMFNVPLPGGTTGHAVGGTLIAILLGPYAACIAVTIALLIQALLFGDGGILAFGANCINMAFILPFAGYYLYNIIRQKLSGKKGEYLGVLIGSYIALNLAALATAIEFGIQPILFKDAAGFPIYCPYSISVSIPAMMIPHLLVAGVVEAVVTLGVYTFVKKVSPGIIYENKELKLKPIYGLLIAMIALSPIGLLAAGTAWGEWGPDEIKEVISGGKALGYVPKGMENGFDFKALMPEYSINGLGEVSGYIISAVAGTAIFIILFKIITAKKKENVSKQLEQ